MYLKERLAVTKPGRFIEIGPGSGEVTELLLNLGWSGASFDLNHETVKALKNRFVREIELNQYQPRQQDFLLFDPSERVDLVISCMVLEHFDDASELKFLTKAKQCLGENGRTVMLVPASTAHWGIEDEIAGHFRRYSLNGLRKLYEANGWNVNHIAGLTFPVSNLLLPISNFLVNRAERHKMSLTALERTKQSGRRTVKYKTYFPQFLGLILNPVTLYPFHLLQKLFARSNRSLVAYLEAS